jgi:serine/threonine protein kinase
MASHPRLDPHLGRTLGGQYCIEALLGSGGMGRVYRGVQLSVKRPVAIKLIAGGSPHPPEWVERFRREAEATARLSHPNTVRLFDFGVTEADELYMVMELLEGETLAAHLASHGPLPLPAALSITRQVLLALSEAHALGIVHRDIKPDNVFLACVRGGDTVAKVMDFGIAGLTHTGVSARLTSTGAVIGTPAYMSTEQAQGRNVDARSDLYSLGVVFFEMLTGKPVFDCNTPLPLLLLHVSQPPKPLLEVGVRVPQQAQVQALLDSLLAKDPNVRPSTRIALSRVSELSSNSGTIAPVQRGMQLAQPRISRSSLAAASGGAPRVLNAATRMPQSEPPVYEPTFHGPSRSPWLLIVLASLVLTAAGVLALRSLPGLGTEVREHFATQAPPAPSPPPALHSVTINSAPSGANVLLGERELGKTPYVFYFQEPTALVLAQRGYERQQVHVTRNSPAELTVSLQREASAKLEVTRPPLKAAGARPSALARVAAPPAAERGNAGPPLEGADESPPEPEQRAEPDPAAPPAAYVPERETGQAIAERFAAYRRAAESATEEREAATPRTDSQPDYRAPSSAEADEAAEADSHSRGHGLRMFGRMLARAVGKVLIPFPERARREALAGQPLRYPSFLEAKRAHDADQIDSVGFQEAVWQLRERRRHAIENERDRYARGTLTRGQYEAQVDRIWAEFWGR